MKTHKLELGDKNVVGARVTQARLRQKMKQVELLAKLQVAGIEKGHTQVKIQILTGIDRSGYSKVEAGKRYMTFDRCRLAMTLETSVGA